MQLQYFSTAFNISVETQNAFPAVPLHVLKRLNAFNTFKIYTVPLQKFYMVCFSISICLRLYFNKKQRKGEAKGKLSPFLLEKNVIYFYKPNAATLFFCACGARHAVFISRH